MFAQSRKNISFLLIAAALTLPACGETNRAPDDVGTGIEGQGTNPFPPGGGTIPPPPPPPVDDGFVDAFRFDFFITGNSINGDPRYGQTPSFTIPEDLEATDSILRVKITPGPFESPIGTGFQIPYGCAQFTVSVNGGDRVTQVLAVDGYDHSGCQNAPESQIINFDNRINFLGPNTITVKNARYDNCHNALGYGFFGYLYYGCSMHPAFDAHIVTGFLAIQVNGTTL